MIHLLDGLLNRITMYRVVLYGLITLTIISFIFSFFNVLSYTPLELGLSLVILVSVSFISNIIFGKIFRAVVNAESSFITAFILFFILPASGTFNGILFLVAAGVIAMLSKYVMAINRKHIFNPAAFAAFFLGVTGFGGAVWWVGADFMLPIVSIVGLIIIRKIRRMSMFLSFMFVSLASFVVMG